MKEFNTASSQHGIHGPHGGICHITKGDPHATIITVKNLVL